MRPFIACIPTVWRQIVRARIRSILTVAGIAVAMFLFTSVEAMREVRSATEAAADDATLVVYRENRFARSRADSPSTTVTTSSGSRSGSGRSVRVLVSNCRASLDVVTFRGVPEAGIDQMIGEAADVSRMDARAGGVGERRSSASPSGSPGNQGRGSVQRGDHRVRRRHRRKRSPQFHVHLPFLQSRSVRAGPAGSSPSSR